MTISYRSQEHKQQMKLEGNDMAKNRKPKHMLESAKKVDEPAELDGEDQEQAERADSDEEL